MNWRSVFLMMILFDSTLTSAEVIRRQTFNEMLRFHRSAGGIDTSLFVDALPIPETIKVAPHVQDLTITSTEGNHVYYSGLPSTKIWGYGGMSPGPTIEVERGQALNIHWKSELPREHLIPTVDEQMPGMSMGALASLPPVGTVTHMHGARVQDSVTKTDKYHNNDGWPDAWIIPGETQHATYLNQQSARSLWYHDHAMGATTRNVAAGLYGMYLIRDSYERSLNLPSGPYEIPLIFETKDFNDDGSLSYPSHMTTEVYGSTVPVNGKICPFLNVEPRKYRFRMLNASNARAFAFKLINTEDKTDGPEMVQIGSDGGFLSKPVILNPPNSRNSNRLKLSSAERADVIIDFSKFSGKTLLLHNNAVGLTGEGQLYIPNIMIFKVGKRLTGRDQSSLPKVLKRVPLIAESSASKVRRVVLNMVLTPNLPPVMTLNDRVWEDPIEESPRVGSTEVWEIINTLPDTHPFHIHLVNFQVLDRREFDLEHYLKTKEIRYTGESIAPDENERGWKDTVTSYPNSVMRIIVRFGPYTGRYAYHCHILEHEDMGMMRPFEIIK